MSESKSEASRQFQPVESPEDTRRVFRDAAKTVSSVLIWTDNQGHMISTNFTLFSESENILYARKPHGFNVLEFESGLPPTKECFCSLSLPSANIFFKASYRGFDTAGLRFEPPRIVYKVQRRKDVRLAIPFGYVMKAELLDPLTEGLTHTRKILDISASGIAFLAEAGDDLLFDKGVKIPGITFQVQNRKITTAGEVKHVGPAPKPQFPNGLKIGVQFNGLRPGDQDLIAAYVFEESRKAFAKFFD